MTKRTTARTNPGTANSRQEGDKVYVDEMYFRHVDQMERWRQEYEHAQAVENKLTVLSKFDYEPVDYSDQLERVPWVEKPMPDFSHLVDKARAAAEEQFYLPIATRIAAMVILLFLLIISSQSWLVWFSGIGSLASLIILYLGIRDRQEGIARAVEQMKQEVARREDAIRKKLEAEKAEHEEKESERIQGIERLLAGELSAMFLKLDTVLPQIGLPFPTHVDLNVYTGTPQLIVWLPAKTIIPKQVCALQSSGRLAYSDKEARVINKQYFEVCAATVMQILTTMYAHVPSLSTCYVQAVSKEGLNNECLIRFKAERESVVTAARAGTAIAALQQFQAKYDCDTTLELLPIEATDPEEWGKFNPQMVRSIRINLFP